MSPRRRLMLSLLALAVAATAAACGGDDAGGTGASAAPPDGNDTPTTTVAGAPGDDVTTVVVKSVRFSPDHVEIDAGETVTWQFKDGGLQHNVVASDFSSPVKRSGTYSHSFTEAGTYSYRCTLHPAMKGVVEVS